MSIEALIQRSKLPSLKRLDPDGEEFYSKQVDGADKGHWRVRYTYHTTGGYRYKWFWERMSDEDMVKGRCFADDYTGPR